MKAIGTAVAGYYTKKFFAVYQTTNLDARGSDCGSKKYRKFFLTEDNFKRVKYRWIVDNGKLVCLTPENAKKYIARIEELIDVNIDLVSVGPNRTQTIIRRNIFE